MQDTRCSECGEPWGNYAIRHDVPDWEDQPDDADERFFAGEGCPSCDWGESDRATGDSHVEHVADMVHGTFDGDPAEYI